MDAKIAGIAQLADCLHHAFGQGLALQPHRPEFSELLSVLHFYVMGQQWAPRTL